MLVLFPGKSITLNVSSHESQTMYDVTNMQTYRPTCFCFCLACENKNLQSMVAKRGRERLQLGGGEEELRPPPQGELCVVLTFTCRWRRCSPVTSHHVAQTGGVTACFPAKTPDGVMAEKIRVTHNVKSDSNNNKSNIRTPLFLLLFQSHGLQS